VGGPLGPNWQETQAATTRSVRHFPCMRRFQSHRLRKGRLSEAGRIYLITANCDRRRSAFLSCTAAEIAIDEMRHQESLGHCDSLAYVVMPDHVHWLLRLQNNAHLSNTVGSMKGRAAVRINRQAGLSGRLWQAGFHDHAVRREQDLENLASYIIQNPLRANLVTDIEHYPHWGSVWFERELFRG